MIISKTPFRISLLGGGTDFPPYYENNKGMVIGGTIDKFCYVTARYLPDVFDYKHRIVWSRNEVVKNNDEIFHPTVKAIFKYLKIKKGLEIHYQGDLQKNSGLGTSSSFNVGLLNSLFNLKKKSISKKEIANKALYIEQKLMKENSGSQDPIWASYGGFNKIIFKKGKFDIKKINISNNNLTKISKNFFLIYTGINKFSNEIEKDKISKISKNFSNLDEIYKLTLEFSKNLVEAKNYDFVGPTLNEYWLIKKRLSNKVSNKKIDEIYKECLLAGASGGKIIGSGGGGFLLIYCKKKNHINLKRRINKLPIVNFNFINEGSKIVFRS